MDKKSDTITSSDKTDEKFPSLASGQLQELRGVVKNPLAGRNVMIPLTSKAFVIGSLNPSKNADGEEQILVRHKAGAELQTCLRKNVCDDLDHEKQRRKDYAKAQKAKKSAVSKGADDNNKQTTLPNAAKKANNRTSTNAAPKQNPTEPSLPYFEIKEEIDGAGKVVRAETINVTKQLELVANHPDESREGESKDDNSMDMEENDDDDFDEEVQVTEEPPANSIPDEQEYSAIAARLDELARLEEEAAATSTENKLSALKLQSKGWSKGFLRGSGSGSAKAKQPVPKKKPLNEQKPSKPNDSHDSAMVTPKSKEKASTTKPKVQVNDNGGWAKGFLNKNKTKTGDDAVKKKTPEVKDSLSAEEQSKKVSFHQSVAEVREIPRVGNVSVASLKKAPPASTMPSTERTTVRPFDSTVFSGVVKERLVSVGMVGESQQAQADEPKKKMSKFAQERMENHGQPTEQTEAPKKKLSKFAQERMEYR